MINEKRRGRPRAFARQAALERAMETFWALGYEGASIALLTNAMGISAQSLYAAFDSKEALYRESLELYRSSIAGFGERALVEEGDVLEAINRLLLEAADVFTRRSETPGCMITMAPGAGSEISLAEFGRQFRADSLRRVEQRLERGVADRQLPSTTDCLAWARFVTGVLQGMSVQARDGASRRELERTADLATTSLRSLSDQALSA